jgi:RNA polymerase sigma factor (TIGR02999 family)
MASPAGDVTLLLERLKSGDREAGERLMPLVYAELRRLAAAQMRFETPGHTLQPTALVHEAYLRMVRIREIDWHGRSHFYAVAAQIMRRILVDHARSRGAAKRGGPQAPLPLDEALAYAEAKSARLLDLDEALNRLEQLDPRKSKVVELRFFGGLNEDEIGAVLGISARTVKRDWSLARAWLAAELAS